MCLSVWLHSTFAMTRRKPAAHLYAVAKTPATAAAKSAFKSALKSAGRLAFMLYVYQLQHCLQVCSRSGLMGGALQLEAMLSYRGEVSPCLSNCALAAAATVRCAGKSASRLVVDEVQLPEWLFDGKEEEEQAAQGDVAAELAEAVQDAAVASDQAAAAVAAGEEQEGADEAAGPAGQMAAAPASSAPQERAMEGESRASVGEARCQAAKHRRRLHAHSRADCWFLFQSEL